MRAIGLMSGTSLDGVHIALIETDGATITAFGPTARHPYTRSEQEVLHRALAEAGQLTDRNARPGVLVEAEAVVKRSGQENALRERIRQRYGDEGLIELALAIAACRTFPVTKRVLGFAVSCSEVTVRV